MLLYLCMYYKIDWEKNGRYRLFYTNKINGYKMFCFVKIWTLFLTKKWWLINDRRRIKLSKDAMLKLFTIEIIKLRRELRQWIWSQLSRLGRLIPNFCREGYFGLHRYWHVMYANMHFKNGLRTYGQKFNAMNQLTIVWDIYWFFNQDCLLNV